MHGRHLRLPACPRADTSAVAGSAGSSHPGTGGALCETAVERACPVTQGGTPDAHTGRHRRRGAAGGSRTAGRPETPEWRG
jgi:hypothetical protein